MQAPAVESISDQTSSGRSDYGLPAMIKVFSGLLLLSFLLRIFYSGHLFQDDGLWMTAAEEILRGKTLYREIYFDKPPAIALIYAALFKVFGAHILTIRLFTIFYTVAVSAVLYLFGALLYNRRLGLISAAMFTVFSTTYLTGHVQGLNTDFLMALPYTAGAYLFARSRSEPKRVRRLSFAVAGGALAGIAFQANPKGAFDLLFFAVLLTIALLGARASMKIGDGIASLAAAAAGFIAGAAPFWVYIAASQAVNDYKVFVWDWGARYAGYYTAGELAYLAIAQTASYLLANNTLLISLAFIAWRVIAHLRRDRIGATGAEAAPEAGFASSRLFDSDLILLSWLAVSYAGMSIGGRFFGHYFFQIIPALCLIGARGMTGIVDLLYSGSSRLSGRTARRAVFVVIALGFAFTLVRFHGRTLFLAVDWARGVKSEATRDWFHERLKREERMAAAVVRGLAVGAEAEEAAEGRTVEAFRKDGPRERGAEGQQDYLFVWGYRPEIYYWSGLLPASRYLSTQPLTGVAADVHYFGGQHGYLLGEGETAPARADLLGELSETRPEYIIDELGFFNKELSIQSYPELAAFMKEYKPLGATGRFFIYRRRDMSRKQRKAN